MRCRIDSSPKGSPTRAVVGDVGKAHIWNSRVRFTNICYLSSRASFPLLRRPSTNWASKCTGCVEPGGRVTPCKRGRAMSRMPSSLFLQSLNDVHFIKEEKKKVLKKLSQKGRVWMKFLSGWKCSTSLMWWCNNGRKDNIYKYIYIYLFIFLLYKHIVCVLLSVPVYSLALFTIIFCLLYWNSLFSYIIDSCTNVSSQQCVSLECQWTPQRREKSFLLLF